MVLHALATTCVLVGAAGVVLRNADADLIEVLAWAMIVVGGSGELFFGLIYFIFFRNS